MAIIALSRLPTLKKGSTLFLKIYKIGSKDFVSVYIQKRSDFLLLANMAIEPNAHITTLPCSVSPLVRSPFQLDLEESLAHASPVPL